MSKQRCRPRSTIGAVYGPTTMRVASRVWGPLGVLLMTGCGGPKQEPTAPSPTASVAVSVAPPARAPAVVEGATNDVRSAQRADCTLAARDVPGEPGQKRFVECPAGCAERYHAVWGSDLYSDDSSVCAAAIHAGAITAAGGVVLFDFLPGRDGYAPSRRAGIESRSWGFWRRSFQVFAVAADGTPSRPTPPPVDRPGPRGGCEATGRTLLSAERPTVEHVCPASCTLATIFGSGEYTDDSSVCVAALHAGATTAAGGKIIVRLGAKRERFEGTTRNGVESRSWSIAHDSFSVSAAP